MDTRQNTSAVVIGGSMAGLLATRILSDHFEKVYLIERDKIHDCPESRKGQPQTAHLHALLSQGLQVMTVYFPDLPEACAAGGATVMDATQTMRWHCYGNYRTSFTFGMKGIFASRTFLEWQVRQRVFRLPNIQIMDGFAVDKLIVKDQQVAGVQIRDHHKQQAHRSVHADLVVDASGRGSRTPGWLEEMGYTRPRESRVSCGTGYTSRIYKRDPNEKHGQSWIFITPEAPEQQCGGGAFPIEGNRWMVSLGGWHGHHAPADEAGFLEFARQLPAPDIYHIIAGAKPLSDFHVYKFPFSLRRHYEKISRFPERFLLLGDAVCSFNPLYGQGMTTAALQALMLDKLLIKRRGDLQGLAKPYFRQIARVLDNPWQTAVGEDFRFPQTTGKKAIGTDIVNTYVAKLHRATHHDVVVSRAFFRVLNMIDPPSSMFRPHLMWRVLRSSVRRLAKKKKATNREDQGVQVGVP